MMYAPIVTLAGAGLAKDLTAGDLMVRGGLDVLAVLVLVGWLYRRRRPLPEVPLALTVLDIGLFAAPPCSSWTTRAPTSRPAP